MNAPSAWVMQHVHLLKPESSILDLACGTGRHALPLAHLGHRLTAVDKSSIALAAFHHPNIVHACHDLETAAWPLTGQSFDAL
ncbi:MAG: hypothetical protein RLZZ502_1045, partial [Pseudomonadota bacterium]